MLRPSGSTASPVEIHNFTSIEFAIATLICYEYLITLQDEIDLFWYHKRSISTWLLVASRYSALAIALSCVFPPSREKCGNPSVQTLFGIIQNLSPEIITAVFSALRVYALLDRNWVIASFVLLLGLVRVGTTIQGLIHQPKFFIYICLAMGGSSYSPTEFQINLLSAVTRILSEVPVVLVTWYKTYRTMRQSMALGMNVGLSTILLRDGSIFFVALFINAVTGLTAGLVPNMALRSVSLFLPTVPLILISRFIINLRQVDDSRTHMPTADTRLNTTLSFRIPIDDIMGNMGESLVFGDDEELSGAVP